MGQSVTTCSANLCAILTAGVAALPAPLPVFPDSNIQTGEDAPDTGYIQAFPLQVLKERQSSRGGPVATFTATFNWPLTIYVPRGSGEGPASDMAEAIAAMFRQKVIGDLTVEEIDCDPQEKQPDDPFFEYDVYVRGEKISDYTVG